MLITLGSKWTLIVLCTLILIMYINYYRYKLKKKYSKTRDYSIDRGKSKGGKSKGEEY